MGRIKEFYHNEINEDVFDFEIWTRRRNRVTAFYDVETLK